MKDRGFGIGHSDLIMMTSGCDKNEPLKLQNTYEIERKKWKERNTGLHLLWLLQNV